MTLNDEGKISCPRKEKYPEVSENSFSIVY